MNIKITDQPENATYRLDAQVGFLLRLAGQRHAAIFQKYAPLDLTPTQFAALVRLCELGECSQNELGRRTAMDVATIKGVVDRLKEKGFVGVKTDPHDKRRAILFIKDKHRGLFEELSKAGHTITAETLRPISLEDQEQFLALLKRICA